MRTIILTTNNVVPNTNNSQFLYKFPGGNVSFTKGNKIALASFTMFYSTFNITATYGNNIIYYVWINGIEYEVLIPDGFYTIANLNSYLQQVMIGNGHYLISNANGQYYYFLTFGTNSTAYAFQLNCYNMNSTDYPITTGTTGYKYPLSIPSGAASWVVPTTNITPMFHITLPGVSNALGFSLGYYPLGGPTFLKDAITNVGGVYTQATAYTSIQSYLSNLVPQITPLSSFVLTCSLLQNNYAVPNSLLYCFAPQGTFGSQFTIQPSGQLSFIDIQPGQYGFFNISILDQNLFPVAIQDPNMVILLIISDTDDKVGMV